MEIRPQARRLLGLGLFVFALALSIGQVGVVWPLVWLKTLAFWYGAGCAIALVFHKTKVARWWLWPFRVLGLGLLLLACLVYLVLGFFAAYEHVDQTLDGSPGQRYVSIRRGGPGNLWTDVVQREHYAFVFYRDTRLAQYDRESVMAMKFEGGRLWVELDEYGKPRRWQALGEAGP
jgi:hypothetical protein